jgi:Holliday junction resolvase
MSNRGHQRERDVVLQLRNEDYVAIRAPGSLGDFDVIACRGGHILLIEVKSTAGGPYERFGPADRARLRMAAEMAGATAWLVWWPKNGKAHWVHESAWPHAKKEAA